MVQTESSPVQVDLTEFPSSHSFRNKLERVIWGIVWLCLYRPSPRVLHGWRRGLLRMFGATIGEGARPHPRVKIWHPANLTMGPYSVLGDDVDCYSVDRITIGAHAVVSQYAFICTATHDFRHPNFPLVTAPVRIEEQAWIAAGAFIAPGVSVGEGAVVGARACVFRDVAPWDIVGGNPAKIIGRRELQPNTVPSE